MLYAFILFFLGSSLLMRLCLYLTVHSPDIRALELPAIFWTGFVYDLGVALFFVAFYALYLMLLPQRLTRTWFNYTMSYLIIFMMVLISVFSFFAEYTFWQEFQSRFNFIAVDYLIYTFEVVSNINESYPLPYLISGVMAITLLVVFVFRGRGYFQTSFRSKASLAGRVAHFVAIVALLCAYSFGLDNSLAEQSENRYRNELSKAGIYSFFSAFRNNELDYEQFYSMTGKEQAFKTVRNRLGSDGSSFTAHDNSINRKVAGNGNAGYPNVIMIVVESFSADFMGRFGNGLGLTPVLDSIAANGIVFSRMYATGTRTVRGMEALSLAVPPTPGNSIVRRRDNADLTTIGSIFRTKGYRTGFFYGGDGYFDNMNQYFGSNGFDITDKGGRIALGDSYHTSRTTFKDSEVRFSNAWGVSDEDLFASVIRDADSKFASGPFYDFVMTTSNHRPFTYPAGTIDIPSGTGREGAVKYSDYAIGRFLSQAAKRPWFKDTVFIFVGDHCASSAGRNEIDVAKYHIPAIIYNLQGAAPRSLEQMCSQIDLYPTLFAMLGWDYESNNYGQDIQAKAYEPRAFVATYQKLGYLKGDSLLVLGPKQHTSAYAYNRQANSQQMIKVPAGLMEEAIAYYQTASYLYRNKGLKLEKETKVNDKPTK